MSTRVAYARLGGMINEITGGPKSCPLLTMKQESLAPCIGKECAMWLPLRKDCSIPLLAEAVDERRRQIARRELRAQMKQRQDREQYQDKRRAEGDIDRLNLPGSVANALVRADLVFISELNKTSDEALLKVRNLGIRGVLKIREAIRNQDKEPQVANGQ